MSTSRTIKSIGSHHLDAVLSFLPLLRNLDPDLACTRWPGIVMENGNLVIHRGENHPIVSELIDRLYEHGFIRDFDWMSWQPRAARLFRNPKLLRRATTETCIKLLTLHARKERFVDGHFAHMVKAGHITAVLTRLRELRRSCFGRELDSISNR